MNWDSTSVACSRSYRENLSKALRCFGCTIFLDSCSSYAFGSAHLVCSNQTSKPSIKFLPTPQIKRGQIIVRLPRRFYSSLFFLDTHTMTPQPTCFLPRRRGLNNNNNKPNTANPLEGNPTTLSCPQLG
jgi:hypothetical protein